MARSASGSPRTWSTYFEVRAFSETCASSASLSCVCDSAGILVNASSPVFSGDSSLVLRRHHWRWHPLALPWIPIGLFLGEDLVPNLVVCPAFVAVALPSPRRLACQTCWSSSVLCPDRFDSRRMCVSTSSSEGEILKTFGCTLLFGTRGLELLVNFWNNWSWPRNIVLCSQRLEGTPCHFYIPAAPLLSRWFPSHGSELEQAVREVALRLTLENEVPPNSILTDNFYSTRQAPRRS